MSSDLEDQSTGYDDEYLTRSQYTEPLNYNLLQHAVVTSFRSVSEDPSEELTSPDSWGDVVDELPFPIVNDGTYDGIEL